MKYIKDMYLRNKFSKPFRWIYTTPPQNPTIITVLSGYLKWEYYICKSEIYKKEIYKNDISWTKAYEK